MALNVRDVQYCHLVDLHHFHSMEINCELWNIFFLN